MSDIVKKPFWGGGHDRTKNWDTSGYLFNSKFQGLFV